jgi:protein O-mannosyl-transferase
MNGLAATESVQAPASAMLRPRLVLSVVLFVGTLILYLPALNGAFINYDDPAYVTANTHVLHGLAWSNLKWAATATIEANWHPLTWISHMTDVQLFGANPRGHHFSSVLVHALNVVLLFFVLQKSTGCLLRSAFVAGLFAVHPLNVECVAWVAERKSLLSMFFLLLALAAYGWYVTGRSVVRYMLVVGVFALALAAKPMAVTLPVLLVLSDYWPLRRTNPSADNPTFLRLFLEKIPLFAMSATSAWITIYAQHRGGALGTTELLPFGTRLANALYSYTLYLGKAVWPRHLAVFYPHPENSLAGWKVLAAGLSLVTITAFVWLRRKDRPYLLAGWLWYVVAMMPMIGIVQVGRQALADRYAYLPFIGLFVAAVWGSSELLAAQQLSSRVQGAIAAGAIVAYASVAFLQINYWQNSYTLFSHTLRVTAHNGIAEDNLGVALMEAGRPDLAFPHFQAAAEYIPQLSTAHYNLAVLQQIENHPEAAVREYELALNYSADATERAQSHGNLGFLLMAGNDLKAAIEQFTAALQINPDKQNCLLGRGLAEYRLNDLDAAIADLTRATEIAPQAQAYFWLGRSLETKGKLDAAANAYAASLELAPTLPEAQQRLDAIRLRR